MFWAEGEGYWEREPISWQEEGKEVRWTRAVKLGALGAEGEGKKARVSFSLLLRFEIEADEVVVLRIHFTSSNTFYTSTSQTGQCYPKSIWPSSSAAPDEWKEKDSR
jgi:hypothetical protein